MDGICSPVLKRAHRGARNIASRLWQKSVEQQDLKSVPCRARSGAHGPGTGARRGRAPQRPRWWRRARRRWWRGRSRAAGRDVQSATCVWSGSIACGACAPAPAPASPGCAPGSPPVLTCLHMVLFMTTCHACHQACQHVNIELMHFALLIHPTDAAHTSTDSSAPL